MKRYTGVKWEGKPWLQEDVDGVFVLHADVRNHLDEQVRELTDERDRALAERDRLKNENMTLHTRVSQMHAKLKLARELYDS